MPATLAGAAQHQVSFLMVMPRLLVFLAIFVSTIGCAYAQEQLYSRRSKDQGIDAFDLSVTEIKRTERVSILQIPGFDSRTAQGSRWLMCVYTDLALRRGFKWWAALYPTSPHEVVAVGFLDSEDQNLAETLGAAFDTKNVLPATSADKLAILCGIRKPPAP